MKTTIAIKNAGLGLILLFCICFFTECSKKNINPTPEIKTPFVSTLAGNDTAGAANKIGYAASFYDPTGVVVDGAGNIFVADFDNNQIRKITPDGSVSLFAGSNTTLYGYPLSGSMNGVGSAASFSDPWGVTIDKNENLYVTDQANGLVRKIDPSGTVSTLAGNSNGIGYADGVGAKASFSQMFGLAVDQTGNVFVADGGNNMIRKISPNGNVSTIAGSGKTGADNGKGVAASFNDPSGVAIDPANNVYVADFGNNEIRKITPNGEVSTFAGNLNLGYSDGTGALASFNHPSAVAVDASGNVFVADDGNCLIRKITPEGATTTIAGTRALGSANGIGTQASFHFPLGIAIDSEGNIYVADSFNNQIRKITFK
jgi:serine/threonine protein kinase, bacterial